jgi:Zn-dependent peptidase ImmA (M78 family)
LVKKESYPKYKRFVLAHELGHHVYKDYNFSANRGFSVFCDYIEKRADDFAMDILMPDSLFIESVKELNDTNALASMF